MNEERFHKWYDNYYDEIYQFLAYLLDDTLAAEDRIHEVFVQAYISTIAPANERAFMYREAFDEVMRLSKKKNFYRRSEQKKLATDDQEVLRFYDEYRTLPVLEKAVLYLHMNRHFSLKEISYIVGEPIEQVKKISERSIALLTKKLPQDLTYTIRQALEHLPEYHDTRSKETFYKRLQTDSRIHRRTKEQTKAKGPRWFTFLAIIIFIILLPIGYDYWQESKESEEEQLPEEVPEQVEKPDEQEPVKEEKPFNERALIGRYALYEADLKQNVPFTIGLVTKDALSVPVTLLIPKSRVVDDLKTPTPTSIELYQQYASLIDEQELGFEEYHPYDASFRTEEKAIYMTLPDTHHYDESAATLEIFTDTLQQTFYGFREIRLITEENEPVELNGVGRVEEPISLYSGLNGYAYYTYDNDGKAYVAPSFGQTYVTVEEAFEALKEAPNDIYTSIVPEGIDFTMTKEDDLVIVSFTRPLIIDDFEEGELYRLFEGMSLTAASFGHSVKLEEIDRRGWKKFDFNRPLPKPISANPIFAFVKEKESRSEE